MYVHKLGMSKMQAWNAYREYRAALGKSGNQEDLAVMAGYKALAKGKTVIDLVQTMKDVGLKSNGLPELAIVRADAKICYCEVSRWGGWARFGQERWPRKNAVGIINMPQGTFTTSQGENLRGEAIVPTIPPKYRPGESTLKNYFIIWEAEWKEVPVDPMLLKPLGKNLFAVVAAWDLTPIERAVLRTRPR